MFHKDDGAAQLLRGENERWRSQRRNMWRPIMEHNRTESLGKEGEDLGTAEGAGDGFGEEWLVWG